MKILKRSSNVYNLILFQIFSFVFLHVVFSLKTGYSALNIERLYTLVSDYIFVVLLLLTNIITIFLVKKLSYIQVIVTSFIISLICFFQFIESFDKTILFYNLFYIFLSFFFIMIWKLELEESVYNPRFDNRELRSSGLQKVKVTLSDESGKEALGIIQNWSRESFFISCKNLELNINNTISVKMNYQGIDFSFDAKIATQSKDGFGLYVIKEQNSSSLNWIDFYDIISDRGIYPINI